MTQEGSNTAHPSSRHVYRLPESAISDEVRAKIALAIGEDAAVYPAKVSGSYKGPVIYSDADVLAQAVGKQRNSAVVHQRTDVEFQGAQLRQRDRNNDLVDRNIQVHYKSEKAKAFPWDAEREGEKRGASASPAAKPAGIPQWDREALLAAAADYAQRTFKTPKQRESYIGHLGAMTDPSARNVGTPSPTQAGPVTSIPTSPSPAPARTAPAQVLAKAEPQLDR